MSRTSVFAIFSQPEDFSNGVQALRAAGFRNPDITVRLPSNGAPKRMEDGILMHVFCRDRQWAEHAKEILTTKGGKETQIAREAPRTLLNSEWPVSHSGGS